MEINSIESAMSVGHAAILGLLQGLTEFLPVSSSGHLIVFSWLLDGKPLPLAINVGLHLGTLVAVLIYFWRDWLGLATASVKRLGGVRSFEADTLLPSLILGSVPAAIVGLLWEKALEEAFHNALCVSITLAVFGLILWLVDRKSGLERRLEDMRLRDGLLIGLAQAFALIPGTSRSGVTITAARALRLNRADAARFSFLLGTPAIGGAVLLKSQAILQYASDPTFQVGVLTSVVVGCLAIGSLLRFVRSYGFGTFAVYRLLLAATTLWLTWRA